MLISLIISLIFIVYMVGFKTYPADERIDRIDEFKWYEMPLKWFMLWAKWTGFTSPHKYYYYIGVPSDRLKKHEYQHGVQTYRDGALMFRLISTYEFIKGLFKYRSFESAYLNVPYEIEARWAEMYAAEMYSKQVRKFGEMMR